jgi:hypothetical protein
LVPCILPKGDLVPVIDAVAVCVRKFGVGTIDVEFLLIQDAVFICIYVQIVAGLVLVFALLT